MRYCIGLFLLASFTIPSYGQEDSAFNTVNDADTAVIAVSGADDVENEEIYILSDFEVSASDDQGYFSANSNSATRTNSLVKNTPITMSIVNEELLSDLGIQSNEDLAAVVSGIDTDPDGFSLDRLRIRGFRASVSRYDYFPRTVPRDGYNVNRVDIIKGANSLIFGQASPGGSINTIPYIANFAKNAAVASYTSGNKDFSRKELTINQIINDQLAVKYMAVDLSQGYNHPYNKFGYKGDTVAVTFKPNSKTNLQLHFENVDTEAYFPVRALKDNTKRDDDNYTFSKIGSVIDAERVNNSWVSFLDNTTGEIATESVPTIDDYSNWTIWNNSSALPNGVPIYGAPSGTQTDYQGILSRWEYNVPYTPDYVKYLSDTVTNHILENSANLNSRADIAALYEGINASNYGSIGGPDKMNDRDGHFYTAKLQHIINDDFEIEFAVNSQEVEGNGLSRDSYGAGTVHQHFNLLYQDDPKTSYNLEYPFIRTYWTKSHWETERDGIKATFIYDGAFPTKFGQHKLVSGVDSDIDKKYAQEYDMIPSGAFEVMQFLGGPEGSYAALDRADNNRFSSAQRSYEYFKLSEGFDATVPGISFDFVRNSNVDLLPLIGDVALTNGQNPLQWQIRQLRAGPTDSYLSYYKFPGQLADSPNGFGIKQIPLGVDPETGNLVAAINLPQAEVPLEDRGDDPLLTTAYRDPATSLPLDNDYALYNYDAENDTYRVYDPSDSLWALKQVQRSEVNTFSQWFALQSEFLNGRVHTLLGARYDAIDLKSSLRKVVVHGYDNLDDPTDDIHNNKESKTYHQVSPSLGLLYWINPSLGIFANYAESIESPGGTQRTPIGEIAPPEYGKGIEGGFRFSLAGKKIDGQIVYYEIEKENDDEFAYTTAMLSTIYPYSKYGSPNGELAGEYSYLYYAPNEGNSFTPSLRQSMMAGRRSVGDVTLSKGVEFDVTYNPSKAVTFLASYNCTLDNSIIGLHPSITPEKQLQYFYQGDQLPGRPKQRANFTARYKFLDGPLRNLAVGLNQTWRSPSMVTFFNFEDENGVIDSQHPLKLGHEFSTNLFMNYSFKLKGPGKPPKVSLGLNIYNILDNRDLINRGNYAFYREGRSVRFMTKIAF
jgi:outer membrane receptor protein involved in Fe transport